MNSRLRKIAFSFGSLGTSLTFLTFTNQAQFYYVDKGYLELSMLSVVWFFYGLWNAINDPIMGRLSDGTRTRFGRRIPYILFGTVPMAVFFYLLWVPPVGISPYLMLLYFAVMTFGFDTLWTLVVLAWTALMPEMWPDLAERAEVAGWREGLSLVGSLVAVGVGTILISQYGFGGMGLIFAVITVISFGISLLGSREKPDAHQDEPNIPFWQGLKTAFRNRSFRWFLLANFGKEFLITMVLATLPFYAKIVLGLNVEDSADDATRQSLLQALPFVLSIPAMVVWTKVTQKIGSQRAWLYASIAAIPAFIVLFLAPNYTVALIGVGLLAVGLPGLLMMHNLLVSDVIDEDHVNEGSRREGLFFGINGSVIRLAYSLQALLIGTIPTLAGYDPDNTVQPVMVIWGFRFLMAIVPILGLLLSIYALRRYPLHGTVLETMRQKMLELRGVSSAAAD